MGWYRGEGEDEGAEQGQVTHQCTVAMAHALVYNQSMYKNVIGFAHTFCLQ